MAGASVPYVFVAIDICSIHTLYFVFSNLFKFYEEDIVVDTISIDLPFY